MIQTYCTVVTVHDPHSDEAVSIYSVIQDSQLSEVEQAQIIERILEEENESREAQDLPPIASLADIGTLVDFVVVATYETATDLIDSEL